MNQSNKPEKSEKPTKKSLKKLYQDPNYFFDHDGTIPFDSVGLFTYLRTYARRQNEDDTNSFVETWQQCIKRVTLACNDQLGCKFSHSELVELYGLLYDLKCSVAGRFLWQLGTRTVDDLGLPSLQNCAGVVVNSPIEPFTWTMSFLMLGCGVGYRILPADLESFPIIKYADISRMDTKDSDFVLPDTRTGWVKLIGKVLKAHFYSGQGFTFSCMLLRSKGAPIKGFGGVASGPEALCEGIEKINTLLNAREGQKLRPVDALDIMNIIGMIVIAGNVRRSAQVAIGDCMDDEFLQAKRWDLGNIPNWRAFSNNSVVCNDITKVLDNDLFWEGYKGNGEPYGLINLDLSRKTGRIGDTQYNDPNVQVYNPCCEQSLNDMETCCLAEIYLPNIKSKDELFTCAKYLYRICKHSLALSCKDSEKTESIVQKNMRMGIGMTGYLQATLEQRGWLSDCYKFLRTYDDTYSKRNKFPRSIKLTTIKPSGTLSLLAGCTSGVHPGYARYYIRRIRISSESPLIKLAQKHRYHIEYVRNFDGTLDRSTKIVSFPYRLPDTTVLANDVSAVDQLDYVKELQTNWSDNSVSCCMSKGHYIHTTVGFLDIGDMCTSPQPGHFTQHSVDIYNREGEVEKSSHNYNNGFKPTLLVRLENGSTIQATPNHRVMTSGNVWKRLDELNETDCVLKIRGINRWPTPEMAERLLVKSPVKSLSIELVRMIAYSQIIGTKNIVEENCEGIPKFIMSSPENCVREYLNIMTSEENTILCNSQTHAEQFQVLFNNFGVRTKIENNVVYINYYDWKMYEAYITIKQQTDEIRVVGIEHGGFNYTFDISTDDTHSYIANGIITHNTIYYKKNELDEIREWLRNNYNDNIKTISFLLHNEHGFDQAPLEEITKEKYEEMMKNTDRIESYEGVCYFHDEKNFGEECAGGVCPIR